MINSTLLHDFLIKASTTKKTINIIGDCLLDQYYQVKPRYNPESNMPAFTVVEDDVVYPGGAGNVAFNLIDMPVKYRLYGSLDSESRDVYAKKGLKTKKCLSTDKKTPKKQRFYQGNTLLHRVDFEIKIEPPVGLEIKDADINVFSDYDKGFLSKPWFNGHLSNAVVEPKPTAGISKWQGCKAIKLNMKEAYEFTKSHNTVEQLHIISKLTGCHNIVITMSGAGVCGLNNGSYFLINQPSVDVKNVIGAGDCFMAFFSYAQSLGFDVLQSSEIAVVASTVFVGRSERMPLKLVDFIVDKVVPFPSLLCDRLGSLVFANGCFDVLHAGHVECLRFAKSKGDKLVVAINSDASVRRLKGDSRPINSLENRVAVIAALDMVDYVVVFDEDTPFEVISAIRPDFIVKGSPYTRDTVVGADLVKDVFICPTVSGLSSTDILRRI